MRPRAGAMIAWVVGIVALALAGRLTGWWGVVVLVPAVVAALTPSTRYVSGLALGAAIGAAAWGGAAAFAAATDAAELASRLAVTFRVGSPWALVAITACVGGICGSVGGLLGRALRALLSPPRETASS